MFTRQPWKTRCDIVAVFPLPIGLTSCAVHTICTHAMSASRIRVGALDTGAACTRIGTVAAFPLLEVGLGVAFTGLRGCSPGPMTVALCF